MDISIVIPCLNEIKTIESVIKEAKSGASIKEVSKFELIVADNGSSDGTLEKLAKIKDVRVLNVPIRGYGAALHYGILSAKYPYVLFADADLSYDFREIHKFLRVVSLKPNFDLILGSRITGKIEKRSNALCQPVHRNSYFKRTHKAFLWD